MKKMTWYRQGIPTPVISESIHTAESILRRETYNPMQVPSKLASVETILPIRPDETPQPTQDSDSIEEMLLATTTTSTESLLDVVEYDPLNFDIEDSIHAPSSSAPFFSLMDIGLLLLACDAPLLEPVSLGGGSSITSDDWTMFDQESTITQV